MINETSGGDSECFDEFGTGSRGLRGIRPYNKVVVLWLGLFLSSSILLIYQS